MSTCHLAQEPLPHVTMLGIGLPSVSCFHDLHASHWHSTCDMLQMRNRLKQPACRGNFATVCTTDPRVFCQVIFLYQQEKMLKLKTPPNVSAAGVVTNSGSHQVSARESRCAARYAWEQLAHTTASGVDKSSLAAFLKDEDGFLPHQNFSSSHTNKWMTFELWLIRHKSASMLSASKRL